MKKIFIVMTILAVAFAADGRSAKRGVSENSFSVEGQMSPIAPGVGWYYNWGIAAGAGYQNQVFDFADMEYVPMCWNGLNATALRAYVEKKPGTKFLLGFNEPNFKLQANLTPAQAAEKWPELQAIARELGLKLVAPALNYSPDAPYQDPTKWMDEFVALVGLDAFDYTALHCYGGLGVMKDLATRFHDKYGKDVWVTEFCYWPGGAGNVYVAPAAQISSMIETVEWLETTEWIYRYAWFKCVGAHNGSNQPNYGLEISKNGLDERELSQQGWVYTYMSEFDMDRYYSVDEVVAATDYVASKSVMMDRGANPDCPRPIEISQLTGGAYADYLFDVPEAGEYTLQLTVSGQGEPTRFDPNVVVYSVDASGKQGAELTSQQFTLSGDNTKYTTVGLKLTLQGGKQRIRVADKNPYQPSGIHISTLRLVDQSGIEGVLADSDAVDVYNALGVKVRSAVQAADALTGLPHGMYIVGNKKILK